jgi:hypothetical protein
LAHFGFVGDEFAESAPLSNSRETRPSLRVALRATHQYSYMPRPFALLRARRERPSDSRAAERG